MDEQKINALVNIGQSKVVEKAYDDLLSEPSKKAGTALGTIVNIGNTLLWPIKWANERTRLYFENNLKKYESKLDEIPDEQITEVPTEISMPILERFTYVSNEELSNAFVKLLASASSTENINKAHPGFIQIIDRLSPDEAIILKYLASLKNLQGVPLLSIKHHNDPNASSQYVFIFKNETGLESKLDLKFSENIKIYFDNLESLGLIQERNYYYTDLEPEFDKIIEEQKGLLENVFSKYTEQNELKRARKESKGMYEKTEFGELFISACIEK
ncbi:DUF4393 domain-containing protein [uncultured Maribacter sp.]|uniref:DUF4393 domain-containing protein n=1 Tax=uncultured Maribacter sp. TaxID=431308 RepID=UPI002605D176|nr:DUF4393 domain-containing protein [uncultured Maribacter sp.]